MIKLSLMVVALTLGSTSISLSANTLKDSTSTQPSITAPIGTVGLPIPPVCSNTTMLHWTGSKWTCRDNLALTQAPKGAVVGSFYKRRSKCSYNWYNAPGCKCPAGTLTVTSGLSGDEGNKNFRNFLCIKN